VKRYLLAILLILSLLLVSCNSGELKALQEKFDQANNENGQLKASVASLETQAQQLNKTIDTLEEQKDQFDAAKKALESKKSELESTIKSLEDEKIKINEKSSLLEGELNVLKEQLENLESAALKRVRTEFGSIVKNSRMSEYEPIEGIKALVVTMYISDVSEDFSDDANQLGEKIGLVSQDPWFDYDRVYFDILYINGQKLFSLDFDVESMEFGQAEYS